MGLFHSPIIITNGLILCLDAGNPVSYPGSGNTWFDLSGKGYNATMSNISFSSNFMTFNGTSSFATIPIPKPSMPITFEFWINPDTSTPSGLYDTYPGFPNVLRHLAADVEWWNRDPAISLNLTAATWQQVVVVYSFTTVRTITYYRNGQLITTATGSTTSTFQWSNPIRIGDINTNQFRYAGKMSVVKIYTSDLGLNGVRQNYNALKGRFGL